MNEPTIRPLGDYESGTYPDGADVVQQHWPYDGPHSPERLADALDALSALVRYANNATTTPDGLGYAPQVYTALGGFTEAMQRVPQLTGQLSSWAYRTVSDVTVRHDLHRGDSDRGEHAGQQTAGTAYEYLREASIQAEMLGDTLAKARSELAHLCHDLPDDGGDQ